MPAGSALISSEVVDIRGKGSAIAAETATAADATVNFVLSLDDPEMRTRNEALC
jgi:hypothetical protein